MAKAKRRSKMAPPANGRQESQPEIQISPQDLQLIIGEQQVTIRLLQDALNKANNRIQELEPDNDDDVEGEDDEGGEDGDT
jgi:uncharacterized coiled-coil protein SlyX